MDAGTALVLLVEQHWVQPASVTLSDVGGHALRQTATGRLAEDLTRVTEEPWSPRSWHSARDEEDPIRIDEEGQK